MRPNKVHDPMRFEFLDHTADISVRLEAETYEGLVEAATEALREVLVEERPRENRAQAASSPERSEILEIPLQFEGEDKESLLVEYLNELIYLFDTQRLIPVSAKRARLSGERGSLRLEAVLIAERFDPSRHMQRSEVKAATYHGLRVRETPGRVQADVVFDM